MPKAKLNFDEETHTYTLGKKKLISVTQLMQKHGLSPNYSAVEEDVLRAKAMYGTLVHSEIEAFIKHKESGFSEEETEFEKWHNKKKFSVEKCEVMVNNDVAAGKIDYIYAEKKGKTAKLVIADHKTTSVLHKDSLSWQLSIYAYLYEQTTGEKIDEYKAFHFTPTLKVVNIEPKPRAEVERLFECERKGISFTQSLDVSDKAIAELAQVETLIKDIETQKKEAESRAKELREAILKAMKENGVSSFDNERLHITYVAPFTRASVDAKKLKDEHPAVYAACVKESTVKESLKITIKEG